MVVRLEIFKEGKVKTNPTVLTKVFFLNLFIQKELLLPAAEAKVLDMEHLLNFCPLPVELARQIKTTLFGKVCQISSILTQMFPVLQFFKTKLLSLVAAAIHLRVENQW